MEKAKEARTENEEANELDTIKLAVVDAIARGTTGYIESLDDLKTALGTISSEVTEKSDGTFEVVGDKTQKIYTINKNGNVEVEGELTPETVGSRAKAGEIQRWDKIDYNPKTRTVQEINLPSGTEISGAINTEGVGDWTVLDVNRETGDVLIMPRKLPDFKVIVNKEQTILNAIRDLNTIAGIYLDTNYARSARSINADDLLKSGNIEEINNLGRCENASEIWNRSRDI